MSTQYLDMAYINFFFLGGGDNILKVLGKSVGG